MCSRVADSEAEVEQLQSEVESLEKQVAVVALPAVSPPRPPKGKLLLQRYSTGIGHLRSVSGNLLYNHSAYMEMACLIMPYMYLILCYISF